MLKFRKDKKETKTNQNNSFDKNIEIGVLFDVIAYTDL